MVIGFEIIANAGGAGRNAYVLDVMPEDERVATQAYMYSAVNVGLTLGAVLGGIALAFDNLTVIRWLPLFTVAISLVNAVFIVRLPKAPHDRRSSGDEPAAQAEPRGRGPLHNIGWMLGSLFTGTMWTNQVLLNVVIPLWLVQATDAPHWLLAWLFGTNTVMCVFLPAYTSRNVETLSDGLRCVRVAGVFFVIACLITMATHDTSRAPDDLPGLARARRRDRRRAVHLRCRLGVPGQADGSGTARRVRRRGRGVQALGGRWAPAAYTFLAMSWHPSGLPAAGWLVIAGIAVLAVVAIHPSVRMAERFLEREGIVDDELPVDEADPGVAPSLT